ncbi:Rne/Rng family ribonuclease [Fulvimarina endophytica]|uniref:Ribonuclease E n=1 Tax=Fulvimarina endophytica TaxID=2293836 RepID=A0A371WZD4_9HYPH|nr:Rne/Rng family ribonuclease [Fulvimarina endophytica]RFC62341.1 Rne/Rng family ribonuclease [Fulvimarina endophytica]
MPNKMLIDASHPEETRVVVVRGNRVEEFDFETEHKKQLKGNIYLAKVTRVEPSLQAAFVEYGGGRHGFLAFSEIHPDYYQIPKADREALVAEELARAQAENDDDDADAEREEQKKRRRKASAARRKDKSDDSVSEDVDAESDGEAASEDEGGNESESEGDDERRESARGGSSHETNGDEDESASEDEDGSEDDDEDDSDSDDGDDEDGESEDDGDDETSEEDGKSRSHRGGQRQKRGRRSSGRGRSRKNGDGNDGSDGDDDDDSVDEVGSEDAMEEVPVRQARVRKNYKIQEVIKRRQILLVQVVKEERGNKGAALTTYLSLAGRYSVLMPNTARGGGISRKITNQSDRKRLRDMVRELEIPRGMGIILRTAGANRTKAEIKRDYEYLMRLWESVRTLTLQSIAPSLVYEEGSLIKRSIRDLFNKDIDQILVSGEAGYREAKDFMRMLMPSQAKVVQPYREPAPIFARQGIEPQLDKMLQPHVTLKSGGYIIINQTEALVAIDVNSGRSTREMSIENTAYQTNLEAAEEIARQLRLRDLAGLIVVDFIDMDEKRNNRAVEKKMKDCLKSDRARIQVGKISHFGLMELSRQRIRASVLESTMKSCPMCEGTGMIRATSSMALHAIRHVEDYLLKNKGRDLIVKVSTETALFILNEKRHHIDELEQANQMRIVIQADHAMGHNDVTVELGGPATKPVTRTVINPASIQDENEIDEELANEAEQDESDFEEDAGTEDDASTSDDRSDETEAKDEGSSEKSRGRGRRRRRRRGGSDEDQSETEGEDNSQAADGEEASAKSDNGSEDDEDGSSGRRRRRRGRRGGRRQRDGQSANDNGSDRTGDDASDVTMSGDETDGSDASAQTDRNHAEPGETETQERDSQPAPSEHTAEEAVSVETSETHEQVVAADAIEAGQPADGQASPSTADERFDDPVASMIGEAAHASDETAGANEQAASETEETPFASNDASTETQAEAAETDVAEAEAEAPRREPLTEPLVTSSSANGGDEAEEKPRRGGWWNRGFF